MLKIIILVIIVWSLYVMYKHRTVIKGKFFLPAEMNGKYGSVDEINRIKKTDFVKFPGSNNPDNIYYLAEVKFDPRIKSDTMTVKGRPTKQGHYIRNTLLFGVVGTLATHDKPAKPDKVYNYTYEAEGFGTLYLINKQLTEMYKVGFSGDSSEYKLLKKYITKNKEVLNAYVHLNPPVKTSEN